MNDFINFMGRPFTDFINITINFGNVVTTKCFKYVATSEVQKST